LFFVIVEDFITILLQLRCFWVGHHGLHDFAAALRADEQAKRNVLISINLHIATCQVFKEKVNGGGAIVLCTFFGIAATLNNIEELIELNHLGAVIIDRLNYFLHLLPIINKP